MRFLDDTLKSSTSGGKLTPTELFIVSNVKFMAQWTAAFATQMVEYASVANESQFLELRRLFHELVGAEKKYAGHMAVR